MFNDGTSNLIEELAANDSKMPIKASSVDLVPNVSRNHLNIFCMKYTLSDYVKIQK